MRILFFLLLNYFLWTPQLWANAESCLQIFTQKTPMRVFSDSGLQIYKSPSSQREIVYDYHKGTQKTVWLLIHGLGDDMSKMQELAELAHKDGFGLLRIDLHGHGKTLSRFLRENENALPNHLDYQDNIEDLKSLIVALQIKDIIIVGHSYGGGIAYGLSADLTSNVDHHVNVKSVHLLAPYVQRIDKFMTTYFRSSRFIRDNTAKMIPESYVFTNFYFSNIMDPFFSLVSLVNDQRQAVRDRINYFLSSEKIKDQFMDPFIERFLRPAYRNHFLAEAKRAGVEITEAVLEKIETKVEASIRVTKGIRGFDLMDSAQDLPLPGSPLQIIGGQKDELVLPAQLKKFSQRLSRNSIDHELTFLQGENSHHLFPRPLAGEIYERILKFLISKSQ